jgi:hypothetical protein
VQRPTYPVSSYYETARQQAWQEPAPRIEFASSVVAQLEEPERYEPPAQGLAFEEPKASTYPEPMRGPVVVEHIPEFAPESTIELSRPEAEVYGSINIQDVLQGAPASKESALELIPVRASVFDDDFFRRPTDELSARAAEGALSKQWPDVRVPSFAGYAGESTSENDELDIPAFLRRKQ